MDDLKDYKGPTFVPGGILEEIYEPEEDFNPSPFDDYYPGGLSPFIMDDDDQENPSPFLFDGSGYYDENGIWHNSDDDLE